MEIRSVPTGTFYEYYTLAPDDTMLEIGPLNPASVYQWSVYAEAAMYSDHREIYADYFARRGTFTTAPSLMHYVGLENPTPFSGAAGADTIITLSCDVYNPFSVDLEYDFYLGTTTDPPLVATGLDAPSYGPDTLAANTFYYWRVVAYNDTDLVEGPLWQFSTEYGGSQDIFAILEIDALQAPTGWHVGEWLRVRLDTNYAPMAPDAPIQADSVKINDIEIPWDAPSSSHYWWEESMPFVENGPANNLVVFGNSEVPHLDYDFTFPACTLAILTPESFDMVSINGFEVTWNYSDCDGAAVWLVLMDGTDSTGVRKLVANDGLDSLTAADLAPLGGVTGQYDLYIIRQVEENLIATGYLPLSIIRFRAINRMILINITGS